MRRYRRDLLCVDLGDEFLIGVVRKEIGKHDNPSEHLLGEGIVDVTLLLLFAFLRLALLCWRLGLHYHACSFYQIGIGIQALPKVEG